jgi:hypothetical protein
MNRQVRVFCVWSVLFFFLFALFSPNDAHCFDTGTLETTGIIMGITFGVALVVVLVVGTIRDLKGRQADDEEDDDVWSQHPVLRTLGYRPIYLPMFSETPSLLEGLSEEALEDERKIEAFLQAKVDSIGSGSPFGRPMRSPCRFTFGTMPGELTFSSPATARTKGTPVISVWRADGRS